MGSSFCGFGWRVLAASWDWIVVENWGPMPLVKDNSMPNAWGITNISENNTAASKPKRRMGWQVTSQAMSGVYTISKKSCFVLISRYSGSVRPAWRIIHMGMLSQASGFCSIFMYGFSIV